jgi:hypothetical protein
MSSSVHLPNVRNFGIGNSSYYLEKKFHVTYIFLYTGILVVGKHFLNSNTMDKRRVEGLEENIEGKE